MNAGNEGLTYRERRERKAERLREWAEKREAKGAQAYERATELGQQIPFGQPILVGHHSEKGHRAHIRRIDSAMSQAVENSSKAERMKEKADNIERAARQAVYSDDPDAIERLREKLARMEAQREAMKARNAAFRKEHRAELKALDSAYARDRAMPHQGYELQNLGGNISRTRKRIAELEAKAHAVESGERGAGRYMRAKYEGTCADCSEPVAKGDPMTYYRMTREVICEACSA